MQKDETASISKVNISVMTEVSVRNADQLGWTVYNGMPVKTDDGQACDTIALPVTVDAQLTRVPGLSILTAIASKTVTLQCNMPNERRP